jgi:outer membrane autotransporter protein
MKRHLPRCAGVKIAAITGGVIALLCSVAWGQTTIAGSLDFTDPTFNRTDIGNPPLPGTGPTVHFDVHPFTVAAAATYAIEVRAAPSGNGTLADPFLVIYQNAFDPFSPLGNALIANDDNSAAGTFDSFIAVNLAPGIQYFAVVTAYSSFQNGSYLLVFNPPVITSAESGHMSPHRPHRRRRPAPVLLIDIGAIQSLLASGIPTALMQREAGLAASRTALRDFGGRLFKARAGLQENSSNDFSSTALTKEEMVIFGEGDGDEAAPSQRTKKVGIQRAAAEKDRWEVFSSFDYGWLDADDVGELRGLQQDVYSSHVGAERRLGKHLAVGLGVAGLESDGEVAGGTADTDVEGMTMAGYVTAYRGRFYADLLYGASLFEHSIHRSTGTGAATAEPKSVVHEVRLNLGYNWELGNVVTGPILGADFSHIDIEEYTERGGDRRIRVDEQRVDSLVSRLGWQASFPAKTPLGLLISQVHAAWERENFDGDDTVGAALVQSPLLLVQGNSARRVGSLGTKVHGRDRERSYLSAGAGVLWALTDAWRILFDYEGHYFDGDYREHYASLRVSFRF